MDYFVANNGNDANDGTQAAPWRTITKVNNSFGSIILPGDNVYFKGGDTFNDTCLTVGISGESISNPMIIGAYGTGNKPNLNYAGSYNIFISGKNYITIDNLTIQNSARLVWAVEGFSYVTIQNCNLLHSPGGWGSVYAHNGSYINVLGSYVYDGHGDLVEYLNVDYGLIEGNILRGSTDHACLAVRSDSNYIIVRANKIYEGSHDNADILYRTENCLFENNEFYNTPGAALKFHGGYRNIVRNNLIYACGRYGLGGYTSPTSPSTGVSHNKWYHNTVYNCGSGSDMNACYRVVIYRDTVYPWSYNVVKNNIFYKGNPQVIYADYVEGWEHMLYGNLWDNNIIFGNIAGKPIRYKKAFYTVNEAESTHPDTFRNNIEANPMLNGDFTPKTGSPAIRTASSLTKTNNTGSGTQVLLEDAGYFCDGFGLISGDEITIGNNPAVRITNVNYDTNIVTIDQSISWNHGDPVYLAGCFDIGAIQSGAEPEPEHKVPLAKIIVAVGLSAFLMWILGRR